MQSISTSSPCRPIAACSFLLALTISIVGLCPAASSQDQPVKTASPGQKISPKKQRLTPQQQRALILLQSAEKEAGAFVPEMRAYVLFQIADGYAVLEDPHSEFLLKKAFEVSTSIDCTDMENSRSSQSASCTTKDLVQRRVLLELFSKSKVTPTLERLLIRAEPQVRQELAQMVVFEDVKQKRFDKAMALLDELARNGDFPYDIAAELISELPAEHSSERVELFARGLNSFKQGRADQGQEPISFARLVSQAAESTPRPLVVEAIDELLRRARDVGAEQQRTITLSTTKGVASFASVYDYTLFELLPIIRGIDSDRADALLSEATQLRSTLQKLPGGAHWQGGTVDPSSLKQETAEIVAMNITGPGTASENATSAAQGYAQSELFARMDDVRTLAGTDPEKALAAAATLPAWSPRGYNSPRGRALIRVARATAKNNPAMAKRALENARTYLASVVNDEGKWLVHKGDMLAEAAGLYAQMGEPESALKTIGEGRKTAEELYSRDTERDDPNLAIKALWPSTVIWGKLVAAAVQVSPDAAEEIIADIPDPEIKGQEKVAFAKALLGASSPRLELIDRRKDGTKAAFF